MATDILREREKQIILSALQREADILNDLERAERCGHDCTERKAIVAGAMDYLRRVNQEFIEELPSQ